MPLSSQPPAGHLVSEEVRGSAGIPPQPAEGTVMGVWLPECFCELSLLLPQVHLRLILVSGKTQDFTFSPNDSATDIAKHVFDNWPAGTLHVLTQCAFVASIVAQT